MTTSEKNKVRLFPILMVLVAGVFFVSSAKRQEILTMWRRTEVIKIRARARDINSPKRSIMGDSGGIACMQMPGDKLLIREGVYPETINNYMVPYSLPSGTDWNNAFTVAAYPGETVVVQRIAIATDDHVNLNLAYWIFDGLHVVNNVPAVTKLYG